MFFLSFWAFMAVQIGRKDSASFRFLCLNFVKLSIDKFNNRYVLRVYGEMA